MNIVDDGGGGGVVRGRDDKLILSVVLRENVKFVSHLNGLMNPPHKLSQVSQYVLMQLVNLLV